MIRGKACFLLALSAVVITSCATEPPSAPEVRQVAFQVKVAEPSERQFTRLARSYPGFAGVWFDGETGELVVNLVRGTSLKEAVVDNAVAIANTRIPSMRGKGQRTNLVEFGYDDLNRYLGLLTIEIGNMGIQSVGTQYRTNSIKITLLPGSDEETIRARLTELGIPQAAVTMAEEPAIRTLALLTDRNRNQIENGFRISDQNDDKCSHGADAVTMSGSNTLYGFVMAGHCSETIEDAGEFIYQNNEDLGNIVGAEAIDPVGFTGGVCPVGKRCRYSDASWVFYTSSSYYAGHKIAESSVIGTTGPGNLTVAAYRLAPAISDIIEGMTVRKTGQTSGTTQGLITSTCTPAWHPQAPTMLRILCSAVVSAYAAEGDSGGPVYQVNGDGAYHLGILWGGTDSGTYYFSPWESITADMPSVWY